MGANSRIYGIAHQTQNEFLSPDYYKTILFPKENDSSRNKYGKMVWAKYCQERRLAHLTLALACNLDIGYVKQKFQDFNLDCLSNGNGTATCN